MTQEGLLGLLVVFVELDFSVDTGLFPEHGHRAADLHVRKTVVVYDYDLLCLAEVCHLSLRVQAAGIIPSSAFLKRPPSYQVVFNLFA